MTVRNADKRHPSNQGFRGRGASATGLDRVSCGWRDGIGPGFATGVTQKVADTVSVLGSGRYCR